ncbi:MAG: apolipoprotein N-acyltransferase, partial [Planctomycetes bacterium]|nr:apolipoprotein N-acyltransferase [Planctomycetota bacterium]
MKPPILPHLALATLSLLLVSAAFHPLDLWPLGWIAFVPWMAYHELRKRRGTARALMLGYFLHFAYVLMWVGWVAWPLVLMIPLLGLPFVWILARFADRGVHKLGLPGIVVYPLAIVTTEVLRDQVLGLTWSSVGYTQWRWIEGVQSASVFRVYAMSWVILVANAALARLWLVWRHGEACAARSAPITARSARWGLLVAAALVAVMHIAGMIRIAAAEFEEGPRAVGVQASIPQKAKMRKSPRDTWRRQKETWDLGGGAAFDPDLLVFAETSFRPVHLPGESLESRVEIPFWGGWFPRGRGQQTVLGYVKTRVISPGEMEKFNIAGVVADGRTLVTESRKRKLVPFGEYIPVPEGFPGRDALIDLVESFAGYVPNQTPGTSFGGATLETRDHRWHYGLNVCYEMVFPPELLGLMRARNPDFIVNISNDGWYGESNELDLVHVATRFRAVETGRAIFRVSNTGISTSVDPIGRYRSTVEVDGVRKSVRGLLKDTIPVARGTTVWV